ncbi:Hyaluronate lyase OS=Streptomyces antimycoticus OX=68175 GN=SANT12839_015340 PE=4 SV=1 [Streptomyces antimycoticus]
MRVAQAHDAVDARRQALNYAFAIKAGLGVEMGVGRRLYTVFARRPGMFHAALTGFRPAWRVFTKITRGTTTLGDLVRTHPAARRALAAMDRG